jgi:hypothetical protein
MKDVLDEGLIITLVFLQPKKEKIGFCFLIGI